jgi:hypothetical protein
MELPRDHLVKYFQEYNPSAVANVDKLLNKYRGREETLCEKLGAKYGVSPKDFHPTKLKAKKIVAERGGGKQDGRAGFLDRGHGSGADKVYDAAQETGTFTKEVAKSGSGQSAAFKNIHSRSSTYGAGGAGTLTDTRNPSGQGGVRKESSGTRNTTATRKVSAETRKPSGFRKLPEKQAEARKPSEREKQKALLEARKASEQTRKASNPPTAPENRKVSAEVRSRQNAAKIMEERRGGQEQGRAGFLDINHGSGADVIYDVDHRADDLAQQEKVHDQAFRTEKNSRFSAYGSYMLSGNVKEATVPDHYLHAQPHKFGKLTKQERKLATNPGIWKDRQVVLTVEWRLVWLVVAGEIGKGEHGDVKAELQLGKTTVVEATQEKTGNLQMFTFSVSGHLDGESTSVVFASYAEDDRDAWMAALNAVHTPRAEPRKPSGMST